MRLPTTPTGRKWYGHSCDDGDEDQRRYITAIEAEAVAAERARLVAGVGGLEATPWFEPETAMDAPVDGYFVDRAAVLALIRDTEGGTE